MKKLVIAAALSALAAPSMAQNVSIYGVLDAAEYRINQDGGKSHTGMVSKANATSRFGIQGVEDLGGGLTAGVKLETELNLATGETGSTSSGVALGTFSRGANVFLSDKAKGTLTLGRQATPVYANFGVGDALGVNSLGFINAVVASHANANKITGETRTAISGVTETSPGLFNNGISYATPSMGGFKITAFTTPGTGTANTDNATAGQRDVTVNYSSGALNAVIGQSRLYDATGAEYNKKNLYAANYTVGAVKFTGGLYQVRYDAYNDIDVKSAGVKYQMNAKTSVGVEYTEAKDKDVTANSSKVIGAVAAYDLSKRTQVYGLVGRSENKGSASLNPIYGGPSITADKEQMAYAVGLKHSF